MKKLIILFGFMVLLLGCLQLENEEAPCIVLTNENQTVINKSNNVFELGKIFDINKNQRLINEEEGLIIELVEIVDNRCPEYAQCLTAGQITAQVKIVDANSGETHEIYLGTAWDKSSEFSIYKIELLDVDLEEGTAKLIIYQNRLTTETFKIGVPFNISEGEVMTDGTYYIELVSVVDSTCPEGEACILIYTGDGVVLQIKNRYTYNVYEISLTEIDNREEFEYYTFVELLSVDIELGTAEIVIDQYLVDELHCEG